MFSSSFPNYQSRHLLQEVLKKYNFKTDKSPNHVIEESHGKYLVTKCSYICLSRDYQKVSDKAQRFLHKKGFKSERSLSS